MTLSFALHTFLLMGTGTWSDLAMAGEDFGTALYYVREGVLAAGFLLYAAFAQLKKTRFPSRKAADVLGVVLVALFAACIVALQVSGQPAVRVPAVLVVALLVGVSGGMVYERVALLAPRSGDGSFAGESGLPEARCGDASRSLGLVVGCGGALAVALQFALQTGLSLGGWLAACLVACFCLVMWLVRTMSPSSSKAQGGDDASPVESSAGCDADDPGALEAVPFICMVVVAVCLFALLLFYEAVLRSSGAVASFYEWHRLFLAAGYIVIGAAAYLGGRPAASVAIVVCALFATIVSVQTAMLEAGPLTAILFYALLGAELAWGAIMFMSVAAQSRHTALVASMWRVLAELVTLLEVLIAAAGDLPMMGVLACSLALLAVVVLAMVKGGLFEPAGRVAEGLEPPRGGVPAPSAEERVLLLARESGLTGREQEVLAALVLTEDKNQQIADELGISRRQLQTHISRIYEKTGTTTRAGLVMRVNGEM